MTEGPRRWVAAGVVALAVLVAAAGADAKVSREFFGVVPQGALGKADFSRMEGVAGTLRIPVNWYEIEPEQGRFEFGALDRVVGEAADHGVRVLPFVFGSPSWVAPEPARPPLATAAARAAWANVFRVLVGRYGPGGDFWRGREARMPIRRWQVWNEPNFLLFWRPWPDAFDYVRLLRIAAGAIRGADPGATVIAAGVAPIQGGISPWIFLRQMYGVPGARAAFDVAAIHPYASTVQGLLYELAETRLVMASGGDAATPLQITEMGVASAARRPTPYAKGRAGQARYLRNAFGALLARKREWLLAGIDWFAWQDGPDDAGCVFCEHAGLLDRAGRPKPAWRAFRRFSRWAQLSQPTEFLKPAKKGKVS